MNHPARVKFLSSPWSTVSGSIAGTTYYSRNGTLVARSRVTPGNPNTAAQQRARADFANTATGWNQLSSSNKDLWDDYAQLTPVSDGLGGTIILTGQQMYSKWAAARNMVGESTNSAPPAGTQGLGAGPSGIVADQTTGEIVVSIEGTGATEAGDCYVRVSAALGVSQLSVHYPVTFDESDPVVADDTSAVINSNVSLVAGNKHVIVARIAYDTGQLSPTYTENVTVISST